jgi:hypothetical protein
VADSGSILTSIRISILSFEQESAPRIDGELEKSSILAAILMAARFDCAESSAESKTELGRSELNLDSGSILVDRITSRIHTELTKNCQL